jgi:hypothetical protein
MQLSRYVEELQQRLVSAAELGGDEARELAQRLSAPLGDAVRLVLLEALSEAANEITAEIAPGAVDVRLQGRDPELVVTPASSGLFESPQPPPSPSRDADDASTSRTTLRLPDQLKAEVEAAAARDGVSVNSWLVRAIAFAVRTPAPPSGGARSSSTSDRLSGWVR